MRRYASLDGLAQAGLAMRPVELDRTAAASILNSFAFEEANVAEAKDAAETFPREATEMGLLEAALRHGALRDSRARDISRVLRAARRAFCSGRPETVSVADVDLVTEVENASMEMSRAARRMLASVGRPVETYRRRPASAEAVAACSPGISTGAALAVVAGLIGAGALAAAIF